ncbi:CoA-binding protein [Bacillus subtilis]|uniref:CoA-binding protein n=1 Tax=Pseudochrobactrum asaccharolyticum TaxID=354351 RepID=UPI001F2A9F32|nr:CoA-binding protein [Pseudochrobactrum asaccharolyticum]MCF7645764.1 CoA-binding protein [Pseudochrobactrum asaccharolyticum]MCF7671171.1 CoA-binding protein [Bacillus subtilis]
MNDEQVKSILQTKHVIALVGASPNEDRPSFGVMKYLLAHGYKVIPVNPGQAGKEILGQMVYASLADISEKIDIVDVFRASNAVPAIVDEILALKTRPDVLWLQLEISHEEAEVKARAAGIQVVTNMCTKQQHQRLIGA